MNAKDMKSDYEGMIIAVLGVAIFGIWTIFASITEKSMSLPALGIMMILGAAILIYSVKIRDDSNDKMDQYINYNKAIGLKTIEN